jgi:hypothetical protein
MIEKVYSNRFIFINILILSLVPNDELLWLPTSVNDEDIDQYLKIIRSEC